MEKKRYIEADVWRTIALFSVLIYHSWVLIGQPQIGNYPLMLIVKLGGELGVSWFFVLSGFGIYNSLENNEKRNTRINHKEYAVARVKRICPNYYASILIVISLTSAATYLSGTGIKHIVTHLFFVHNLFVETHGSIISVLWTMGVIVQFYVLAPFLFKLVKTNGKITLWGSILVSILLKIFLFAFLTKRELSATCYFVYSRQLCTALDNFVVGMYVAQVCKNAKEAKSTNIIQELLAIVVLLLWCAYGDKYGIYTNNLSGYIWHSGLVVILGIILYICNIARRNQTRLWKKIFLYIAKEEYGIYIWHFIIMSNLLSNSEFFVNLLAKKNYFVIVVMHVFFSVITGIVLSKGADMLIEKKKK